MDPGGGLGLSEGWERDGGPGMAEEAASSDRLGGGLVSVSKWPPFSWSPTPCLPGCLHFGFRFLCSCSPGNVPFKS